MARLTRAKAGSTLAMLAAFLIPLAAISGAAVDVGRMYLVKVRLQQACDAGALAGRKFMASSNSRTLDDTAAAQARAFFASNFPSGMMGTAAYSKDTVPFSPTKTADDQVAGTASVRVPMTIMKMFGAPTRAVTATCKARYDVVDTDVMFVLDTTGSMVCAPEEVYCPQVKVTYKRPDDIEAPSFAEKPSSKIVALRNAVVNFYDTVNANKSHHTHIRYGIVPYSSPVNAGRALKSQYILSTRWTYQSRRAIHDQNSGWLSTDVDRYPNVSSTDCDRYAKRTPALYINMFGKPEYTYDNSGRAMLRVVDGWAPNYNGANLGTCRVRNQLVVPLWRYQPWPADISGFVASLTTGQGVQDPSKAVPSLNIWQGCLEERQTTASTSFDAKNPPPDLDPDLIPYNDETRWKPMWPEQVYDRSGNVFFELSQQYLPPDQNNDEYYKLVPNIGNGVVLPSGAYSCGKAVHRLTEMSRTEIYNYVHANDFRAFGATYHDIGMIWGTRLLSPTGIFAADTAAQPGRKPPNRILIFMTDGDMAPGEGGYSMYGTETYDKRVTADDLKSQKSRHNARFVAACGTAKLRGIKVIVIGFAQVLTPELTECASPGQTFYASDTAGLNAAFRKIANQVATLRVSK